ncbi:MAG TPA: hypothetical protein VF540_05795 [Segetibacter sp.]
MKGHLKVLLIVFLSQLFINFAYSQAKPSPSNRADTSLKQNVEQTNDKSKSSDPQLEIAELRKEIAELSKNIADNKQTFYDSKLNLWNFILTAFGLVIVIAGYFGYRSIADKITEVKAENQRSSDKSEEGVREIKADLIQRIIENKTDIKDFKSDQQKAFEKFENEANERISKGLDLALQQAIEQIMKGSYSKVIDDLNEQVADLRNNVEALKSNNSAAETGTADKQDIKSHSTIQPSTKSSENAFD